MLLLTNKTYYLNYFQLELKFKQNVLNKMIIYLPAIGSSALSTSDFTQENLLAGYSRNS